MASRVAREPWRRSGENDVKAKNQHDAILWKPSSKPLHGRTRASTKGPGGVGFPILRSCGTLLPDSRPAFLVPQAGNLTYNGRRALLIERYTGASAQGRVGDYSATWKVLLAPFQKVSENRLHKLHKTNDRVSSIWPFRNEYLSKQPQSITHHLPTPGTDPELLTEIYLPDPPP
jgi:hypothetical protein